MFKHSVRVGQVLRILVGVLLVLSGFSKVSGQAAIIENFAHLGLGAELARPIGIVEILCAVLFLIPRTSFVGAILVSSYFGGAVLAHTRIGEPPVPAVALGVIAWVAYGLANEPVMRAALGMSPKA